MVGHMPNLFFSAQPTGCQKDRHTLIEQSNTLMMQSVAMLPATY